MEKKVQIVNSTFNNLVMRSEKLSEYEKIGTIHELQSLLWIPVGSGLTPEEKENEITKDYHIYPVMVNIGGTIDIRYYSYGKGHWWHGLTKMDQYVTHWMNIRPFVCNKEYCDKCDYYSNVIGACNVPFI